MRTFIHDEFVGSRRPLNVTVSSECGDSDPVILITGIFSVFDDCGVPDGVRAICKSVRCMYELMSMARFVGFTERSKCDLYICNGNNNMVFPPSDKTPINSDRWTHGQV